MYFRPNIAVGRGMIPCQTKGIVTLIVFLMYQFLVGYWILKCQLWNLTTQLKLTQVALRLLPNHVSDGGAARALQGVLPLAGQDGGVEHCLLPALRVVQETRGLVKSSVILLADLSGCHTGNGEKLSSNEWDQCQLISSAVAYFYSSCSYVAFWLVAQLYLGREIVVLLRDRGHILNDFVGDVCDLSQSSWTWAL